MTYVNVASGYASAAEAGGFTSEIDPSGFVVPTFAAAVTDATPGSGYLPAAFWSSAYCSPFCVTYVRSTYVTAPSVAWTAATTPLECSAPVPVGKGGCVEVPTLFAQSGLTFVSQSVNAKLVPEPSLR